MSPEQLSLDVRVHEMPSFDNFFAGDNSELITTLQRMITTRESGVVYLWGKKAVGRSHLLQACCNLAEQLQLSAFYVDLMFEQLQPSMLDDLQLTDVVCIDDVHQVGGNQNWEQALFNCYNDLHANKKILVITSDNIPADCGFQLPDLISRFAAGAIYHLHELSDQQKMQALQLRAHAKGLELSDRVVNYMMLHCPRDMGQLYTLLNKLDQLSLDKKRAITVPLLKEVLGGRRVDQSNQA